MAADARADELALTLPYMKLMKICKDNELARSICTDHKFWTTKLYRDYGLSLDDITMLGFHNNPIKLYYTLNTPPEYITNPNFKKTDEYLHLVDFIFRVGYLGNLKLAMAFITSALNSDIISLEYFAAHNDQTNSKPLTLDQVLSEHIININSDRSVDNVLIPQLRYYFAHGAGMGNNRDLIDILVQAYPLDRKLQLAALNGTARAGNTTLFYYLWDLISKYSGMYVRCNFDDTLKQAMDNKNMVLVHFLLDNGQICDTNLREAAIKSINYQNTVQIRPKL